MRVLTAQEGGRIVPTVHTWGVPKMATQELARLEEKISALQTQLDRMSWKFQCPKCGSRVNSQAFSDIKPSEAIMTILREEDRPLGVGRVKKRLSERGYPMERFGPRHHYFYTLICRLAQSKKIQRLEGDEIMVAG